MMVGMSTLDWHSRSSFPVRAVSVCLAASIRGSMYDAGERHTSDMVLNSASRGSAHAGARSEANTKSALKTDGRRGETKGSVWQHRVNECNERGGGARQHGLDDWILLVMSVHRERREEGHAPTMRTRLAA